MNLSLDLGILNHTDDQDDVLLLQVMERSLLHTWGIDGPHATTQPKLTFLGQKMCLKGYWYSFSPWNFAIIIVKLRLSNKQKKKDSCKKPTCISKYYNVSKMVNTTICYSISYWQMMDLKKVIIIKKFKDVTTIILIKLHHSVWIKYKMVSNQWSTQLFNTF